MTKNETYPWLKFQLDLKNMDSSFWMIFGEINSKIDHIARVPLRPSTAKKINRVYLAKGALSTTAIEGNTLSEEEVNQHIDGKLKLPPSRQYLQQEVDNIISACNAMGEMINHGETLEISPAEIMQLNRQVLQNTNYAGSTKPGRIRSISVGVGSYRPPKARDCEGLLERLCHWLNSDEFNSEDSNRKLILAVIKSIIAHLYLVWIHPFEDGNGRTARLLEFRILLDATIPGPVAHLLSNHYNQTRSEYYKMLDASSRKKNGEILFLKYSAIGLRDQLKEQLEFIWEQIWDVTWRNIVHETFSGHKETSIRKRYLLLDLSVYQRQKNLEWVNYNDLSNISGRVIKQYFGKTDRTKRRDILELLERGFLKTDKGLFSVNFGYLFRFLPLQKQSNEQ
jgi:Fic family protein